MENIFQSYFLGGFECCDMLNRYGRRVDLLKETKHVEHADEDYGNLKDLNIFSVREGIRWSQVEKTAYQYNWCEVHKLFEAGKRNRIQQIWDICHFGMPDDLSPLHPQFAKRLIRVCLAFISEYRKYFKNEVLIITPINEVSFYSWLGGEVGATTPYTKGLGWDVKYQMAKAYIAAIKAMKEFDANLKILSTEPLVDIVPPIFATEEEKISANKSHDEQYQLTDIVCGRICTELGGQEDLIDIIGYNFYYSNRFTKDGTEVLSWVNEFNDERFRPLHLLLKEGYNRYNKPLLLAETSHPGEHRNIWMEQVIEETNIALLHGVPLWGICWYPVLDRPDWDELHIWHDSGIYNKQCRLKQAKVFEPLAGLFKNHSCIKSFN